jgi:hypothetical protein
VAVAVTAGSNSRICTSTQQPLSTAFNVFFLTCPRMAFRHPGDGFFFDFLAKLKTNRLRKEINLFFSQL